MPPPPGWLQVTLGDTFNPAVVRIAGRASLTILELPVKPGIHPRYQRVTVQCACGNTFVTRSTVASIHVEICARCHPYFTGKQKLVDTAGRVERFRQRYKTAVAESKEA